MERSSVSVAATSIENAPIWSPSAPDNLPHALANTLVSIVGTFPLGRIKQAAPVHSPAQAEATYGAIDTITVPPFFSLDWNDFDEWLNFGFDDEYMRLSAPAASATAAIAGLYGNIQEPDMDKDAIDPRQYFPASIELDAQLVFPDMTTIASEDIEKENLALVEQVPDGVPRKVLEMATELQTKSNYPKFIELRIPPARVLNAWVQLYFKHFHPVFPILHKPTFSPATMNPFLVLTVAAIGAHFSELEGSQACQKAMHELIRRYTSYTCEQCNRTSRELWITQTILLNQLGLMYSGNRRDLELAELVQAVPVTLARRKRLLSNTLPHARISALQLPLGQEWQLSIHDEERRQAGFAIWLIDFGWKYSFGLNHVMTADELQNCLPQSDDCWDATTAQQWAQIMEARSFSTVPSLPQTIADQNWIWAWSQTGTLGKQTILHYLTSIVTKDDADSSSQGCWSEQRLAAATTLKSLLGELGEGHTKAAVLHRVLICSGLMIHYSPTLRIKSFCLRVIYRRMDDTSWDLLSRQWAKTPFQGRLAVLYAAQVFETIRLNRCLHFLTPASLLRAVLVLWVYSTLCQRMFGDNGYGKVDCKWISLPQASWNWKSALSPGGA
ncbi:hypothetical protein CNMCM8980_002205 [Aspergillus fumigatiaffinis]|uniref:Xylanolytic transcriptional activator regulatory domain-containing protein n=1 Tax=Aspergillus fumigatiaffinis TaxID=340414 RepID=A0A8H4M4A1_9EURO|nr:hypothetical protein CNMCM6805_002620 [Aspergillus fumigatiaffinis]KAF4238085.1 hypothetical protein CNMCM8980_002205 [Aspergillus fumigatiaffinis]